jgi:hypothetical protein
VIAACVVILAVLLVVIFAPSGIYTFRHPFRAIRNARFARVSGEVFLVDSDGKVHAAPGASVTFYENDKHHSSFNFSEWDKSRRDKSEAKAREARDKGIKLIMEAANTEAAFAAAKDRADFYEDMAKHEEDWFCMGTDSEIYKFFESEQLRFTAVETSDREGRFSVDLPPGWFRRRGYTVVVQGQAGQQNAIWIEEVHLKWRSQVRLVNPYCTYAAFNLQH